MSLPAHPETTSPRSSLDRHVATGVPGFLVGCLRRGDGDRASGARCRKNGFTLVELSIVLFIIAVVAGIGIPRLRDLTSAQLTSTTRRLAATVQYLSEEAALRRIPFSLTFDLDAGAWWVLRIDPSTGELVEDKEIPSRRYSLPEGVAIADVVHPDLGKIQDGIVPANFYPEGFADAAVIHLVDDRNAAYTVRIHPIRGRAEVLEGYHDFER